MKTVSKKLMLNQLINISWTLLAFTPILIYWSGQHFYTTIYIYLAISAIFGLVPKHIFERLQLSYKPEFYERLGVKKIRHFVQDGDIINRSIRKDLPHHRIIRDKSSLVKYLKTVEMYERYHFICLIFFLLISVHAFENSRYTISIIITTCNFLYNVCPILLQQFNTARVLNLRRNNENLNNGKSK